jgi:CheY-like chemotaxis protein
MSIPAPGSVWPFAGGLSNVPPDVSGSNLNPDEDLSSVSHSRQAINPRTPAPVLIVEDNASDVELLQLAFAFNGLRPDLTVVADGALAIEFIDRIDAGQAECPALVILDVNLPKRSGFEVLERLRRSVHCARVPVVVLSSSNAPKDRTAAANLGADRYINKPSDIDEFMQIGAIFKTLLEGE